MINCDWNSPGADPYRGDVASAVESYSDIPPIARQRLRERMAVRDYDDVAEITRDDIRGRSKYTDLRSMHFGNGRQCARPSRERWTDTMRERGLIYCEDQHCLIVPTVCRNVSRVTRAPAQAPFREDDATLTAGGGGAGSFTSLAVPSQPPRPDDEAPPVVDLQLPAPAPPDWVVYGPAPIIPPIPPPPRPPVPELPSAHMMLLALAAVSLKKLFGWLRR